MMKKWLYFVIMFTFSGANIMNSTQHPTYFVLIGPPGAGKGTIANKLSLETGVPVITTSAVLKTSLQEESDTSKTIKQLMNSGQFVPDEIIHELLSKELADSKYEKGHL